MKCDAFISYSHVADGKLAPAIQMGLEQFAKPWHKRRALSVFRDVTNLSASPHLWNSIVAQLSESGWFLLLASPAAARSKWVAREVEWWLSHRDRNRLLILLTEGELHWGTGGDASDFDWDRTDALPLSLKGVFDGEPNFVDLRSIRNDATLTLKHTTFRAALLKISAPLHGLGPEEMDGEAVRVHARNRRWAAGAAASLVLATAAAIWQTLAAIESRDIAFSRQLAAQSIGTLERSSDTAMLLAIEAYRIKPTAEARTALLRGLQLAPIERFLPGHSTPLVAVALDRDARRVATASEGGTVIIWSIEDTPPTRLWVHTSDVRIGSMAWTPDGSRVAIGRADGRIQVFVPGGADSPRTLEGGHHRTVTALAFAPSGRRLVSGDMDGSVVFWDAEAGTLLGGKPNEHNWHPRRSLAFSPDERRAYVGGDDGVTIWDADARRELGTLAGHQKEILVNDLALTADGRAVVASGFGGDLKPFVLRWSLADPSPVPTRLSITVNHANGVASSANGSVVAVAGDGRVVMLQFGVETFLQAHHGTVTRVAISADGRRVVSGGEDGRVIVWAPTADRPHHRTLGVDSRGAANLVATPDGRRLVSGNREGRLLWISADGDVPQLRVGDAVAETGVTALALRAEGGRLAIGAEDGTIAMQEIDAAEPYTRVRDWLRGHAVTALSFSPDGNALVSAHDDGSVVLRDPSTAAARANAVKVVNDSADGIIRVQFSADGKRLLVTRHRGGLLVRDAGGQAVDTPVARATGQFTTAAFRSDWRGWAFAAADGSVHLRPSDVDPVDRAPLLIEGGLHPTGLAFSPDRTHLAVGGADGRIVLSDLRARRLVDEPLRQRTAVMSAVFTADGRYLVTRAFRDALHVWNVDGASWARTLCDIANRRLTEREWNTYLGGELAYRPACVPPAPAE